mmetsp:Transcript_27120/g.62932  ORF Transcript_27120/g.62932 Transcript_27120/m.62932 type:complete len:230 (-) Transcript_27120:223-912(-)
MSWQMGGYDEDEPRLTLHRSKSWTADADDSDEGGIQRQVVARLRSEDPEDCLGRKAVMRAAIQARKQEIKSPEEALERIFNLATTSPWMRDKTPLKHVDSMELIGQMDEDDSMYESSDCGDAGHPWDSHDYLRKTRYFMDDEADSGAKADDAFAVRPEQVMPSTLPHVDSSELFSKMWGQIGSSWDSPRGNESPTRYFDARASLLAAAQRHQSSESRALRSPPVVESRV